MAIRCRKAPSPVWALLAFPHETGVRVWDVAAGKELYRLDPGAKTPMGCVAFSFEGKWLASASNPSERGPEQDHTIHLWDMATGKEAGALKGHPDVIRALAMSPKSSLLASASLDGTIRFWDLAKRQEIGRSLAPYRAFVALRFSADGKVLASGEENGVLRLWDSGNQTEITTATAAAKTLQWVAFAPDGQTVISADREQIGLWEPLTGRLRRGFNTPFLIA